MSMSRIGKRLWAERAGVRRLLSGLVCVAGLAAGASEVAAQTTSTPAAMPGQPALIDFFRHPQMRSAELSPNGKYLAAVVRSGDGSSMLAVIEVDQPKNVKVVAGFGDASIGRFDWVNNDYLVYSAGMTEEGNVRELQASGLWSVHRDGSGERLLIVPKVGVRDSTSSRVVDRTLTPDWALAAVPQDGSSEVVVLNVRGDTKGDLRAVRLARLNVETGIRRFIDEGAPQGTQAWWVDATGQPWALQTRQNDQVAVYLKGRAGDWIRWKTGDLYVDPPPTPVSSDGQSLRLIAQRNAQGTTALFRVDPETLKIEDQPLISAKGFDVTGGLAYDRNSKRALGLYYNTDAPGSLWFDAKLKGWQAAVDKLLPGRANLLQCGECMTSSRMLVVSQSDVQPAEFYLFDGASGKMQMIGSSRPWIKASEMGQRDLVRIRARDGLEIPVMVTLPRGKAAGPRPAVVLVHGGPYVQGTQWTWNPVSQFLATRGYVVIEPEFRGSTGYGDPLFRAGWKQWGLAMQDDVSDALQWAIKKGWVDAKRVCIAGASYGGYATLMGLIKDPAQYQCGVSWVGVTDIDLLYSVHWSDASDVWKDFGMTAMVGDRVKDAEQFRRTSPLKRAAELKQPLLLAYGASDLRVPLTHGTEFKGAVEAAGNKDVEWVVYAGEGHGWAKLENNLDFFGRVERFLAKHIGTAPSPAPAAQPAAAP